MSLALLRIRGGRAPNEVQKSGVVNDFIKRLGSPGSDILPRPLDQRAQGPLVPRILFDLPVPPIGLASFVLGQPGKELVQIAGGEELSPARQAS